MLEYIRNVNIIQTLMNVWKANREKWTVITYFYISCVCIHTRAHTWTQTHMQHKTQTIDSRKKHDKKPTRKNSDLGAERSWVVKSIQVNALNFQSHLCLILHYSVLLTWLNYVHIQRFFDKNKVVSKLKGLESTNKIIFLLWQKIFDTNKYIFIYIYLSNSWHNGKAITK